MICHRCLHRAYALRASSSFIRLFSSSSHFQNSPAPIASTSAVQPLPTSHSPTPNPISLGSNLRPTLKSPDAEAIVSSVAAGTPLRGINYLKNQNDPVALREDEYPAWLWRCLDEKKKDDTDNTVDADLFAKSKKLRRKAAKRQRKLEEARLASGDMSLFDPKVPLTQQSIDLPSNPDGTIEGALEADEKREELRAAMRRERRAKIKENNYLKSV